MRTGTTGTKNPGTSNASSPGPPVAAAPARVCRRCPGCGAEIEHGEDDGVVGCDYCGLRLAIATPAHAPSYALAARGEPRDWLVAAKSILREADRRVLEMEPPRVIHIPFHRLRAHAWQWYRERPHAEPADADLPPLPALEGEARFRLGSWDATEDAAPALGLGPANLGFRTQVLAWKPLADFLGPAQPGAGGKSDAADRASADEAVFPAILPAETSVARARGILAQRLAAAWEFAVDEASDQWILVTDATQQLLHAPLVLCPFRGPEGRGAVVLDAVTLDGDRIIDGARLAELESRELAARSRPPDARPAGALLPFVCPECSAPLPFVARARVHGCGICGRHWSVQGAALAQVPAVLLGLPGAAPPPGGARLVPFYRLRGRDGTWFVPATRGRNPRATWNFALGITRRSREWQEAEFLGGAGPAADIAIEVTPATARALAPFVARCLERPEPGPVEVDLAWIAFAARGPDLVELHGGLGFPRIALTPWETGDPRAGTRPR